MTVLLSGLVSGILLFALQERRERNALLLSKAEAAVEAYVAWADSVLAWPQAHFDIFTPYLDQRAPARDNLKRVWTEANRTGARAQMLIHIYLPEQTGAISSLILAYQAWLATSTELQNQSLRGAPPPDNLGDIIGAAGTAIIAGIKTAQLYGAARSLVHSPFLVDRARFRRKAKGVVQANVAPPAKQS
ncbi:hypothetical protein [Sphingomonas asaccharolytica]|uniref:hypothetical protein n=1 Tax=Sphingomonas asaccharolytica TaxID=40681 RepID=UPI001C3F6DDA|nr:hypothetical protein [Sphingomonas asaccharolytica]